MTAVVVAVLNNSHDRMAKEKTSAGRQYFPGLNTCQDSTKRGQVRIIGYAIGVGVGVVVVTGGYLRRSVSRSTHWLLDNERERERKRERE